MPKSALPPTNLPKKTLKRKKKKTRKMIRIIKTRNDHIKRGYYVASFLVSLFSPAFW